MSTPCTIRSLPRAPRRAPRGRFGFTVVPPAEVRRVRAAFARLLPVGERVELHLRAVVRDTLAHPGSLARAQLACGVGKRLGLPPGPALNLAIAVEYFHAASLIFDDMPAMDDAAVRRGRPCPHLVYGEGAAVLGALALITRAYELVWQAVGNLPARRRTRATALVGECLGVSGILDGQAHDLHFSRARASLCEIEQVAAAKTVPLLRLALVLPAVAAGAPARVTAALEGLAASWGLAYQVIDDFKDVLLDEAESGKTSARDRSLGRPNMPETAGVDRALASLDAQFEKARLALAALPRPESAAWHPLQRLQTALEDGRRELAERLERARAAR